MSLSITVLPIVAHPLTTRGRRGQRQGQRQGQGRKGQREGPTQDEAMQLFHRAGVLHPGAPLGPRAVDGPGSAWYPLALVMLGRATSAHSRTGSTRSACRWTTTRSGRLLTWGMTRREGRGGVQLSCPCTLLELYYPLARVGRSRANLQISEDLNLPRPAREDLYKPIASQSLRLRARQQPTGPAGAQSGGA